MQEFKLVLVDGSTVQPQVIVKGGVHRYVFGEIAEVTVREKTTYKDGSKRLLITYSQKRHMSQKLFYGSQILEADQTSIIIPPTKPNYVVHTLPKLKPPPNCIVPTMKEIPDNMVSIIILSYNTRDITTNCITSVLENTIHPFELFVVDNGSKDGTVNHLRSEPYLTMAALDQNLGFSKANNLAIRCARGKYVCLLNSDIVVMTRGWLGHMVRLAEGDKRIGTVGAKLLYSNGKIQHVGGGIHGTNPYHPYDKYPNNIAVVERDVPYNTGACLLITRTALDVVGLLDEDYPFGFEDVDYGLKIVEKGLRNVVCHKAVLTHLWAYTQRKIGKGITGASLAIYHRKWDHKLDEIAKKVTLDWGAPWHV